MHNLYAWLTSLGAQVQGYLIVMTSNVVVDNIVVALVIVAVLIQFHRGLFVNNPEDIIRREVILLMSPSKRRQLDFWLLAGMIGLWVYWLFLYRTGLLNYSMVKFYLLLLWRNKLPVLLFSSIFIIAFWCFRKKRWGIGTAVVFMTVAISYWAYGPDFPKLSPLNPQKVFWQQTPSRIPVVLVISYAYEEEIPPLPFIKLQEWLYRNKVWMTEEEVKNLSSQAKEALVESARRAGEDDRLFEKCLNLALHRVPTVTSEIAVPLLAEKRYEHVTGQLCWVFGFARLRQERKGSVSIWSFLPSFDPWIAVRLRFPQKAWLTYLAIEPEHALRNLFLTLVVIVGYVVFLKVLRYAFDKWF